VSSKSLRGEAAKWPGRYPELWKVKDIFIQDECVLNLIHFASKDRGAALLDQLRRLVDIGGEKLDGFQLNTAWPDENVMEAFKNAYPDIQMVLQLGAGALLEHTPESAAKRVRRYEGLAEYALVDPSGGNGLTFDVEWARSMLRALQSACSDMKLVIAGGFGPQSLDHLVPIAGEFPGISIDAEGKLRTPHPEDRMDQEAVKDYIQQASLLLSPD
jgi:hypothetical protein